MSEEVDKSRPLYARIVSDVLRKIQQEDLSPGDQMPSQAELCAQYDVSRMTIRKALGDLAAMGVIETKPGIGTFVCRPPGRAPSLDPTNCIGLVLRDFSSPFFSEVMQGVERHVYELGYNLLLSNSSGLASKEDSQIEHFRKMGVRGLVIASMRNMDVPSEAIMRLHAEGFPYVMVSYIRDRRFNYVGVDQHQGGAIAARHLLDCGYRRFGYLNSEASNLLGDERRRGFLAELRGAGVSESDLVEIRLEDRWDINRFQKGYEAGDAFAALTDRPEAMFVYNDSAALGFCRRLSELGVEVPQRLGVVGFDGIHQADFGTTRLTTVRQPMEEIGVLAVDNVVQRIEGREAATRTLVEPSIREGETTAMSAANRVRVNQPAIAGPGGV